MRIAAATIAMGSAHLAVQRDEQRRTLETWQMPAPATAAPVSAPSRGTERTGSGDLRIDLLRTMIEWLTGEPVKIFDATRLPPQAAASQAPPAPARTAAGMAFEYHAIHEEVEQTDVSIAGSVTTADGRQIDFGLEVQMSRQYSERVDVAVQAGQARRTDPLVLNAGGAASLSEDRMDFDLDGDGKAESVPLLGGNSAYLALDLDGNGKIDSGAELFGPASGSGFAELARYDTDRNGWIDENDPIFKQLKAWAPSPEGGTLSSLADWDVGALSLASVASPFELRGAENQDLGAVRSTGFYLTESGRANSLQEIDLSV